MTWKKAFPSSNGKARVALRVGGAVLAAAMIVTNAGGATAQPAAEVARAGAPALGPTFRHGYVDVDGVRLHYVRGGSGPAMVLLHGWPQTWHEWQSVMPELAQSRTVIAFDLPGLGDSSHPAGGYDKATTARRIHAAVEKLGFRTVELVGHDVGALVAYPYARDFPQGVSRMIVIETPLAGFGLEDLYGVSWHFLFNASPAPIPERIMDNDDVPTYLGQIFDFTFKKDAIDRNVYYRAYTDPADRTSGYNYYRAFAADNADNRANASRRLAMPVIAMGGQYSFGPGVAASFSQVADDVRTVVAPDAAHFVPEENPRFLIDCSKLFFGITPGPASSPELTACAA
jgi:pimeloyl-ACP methyl ester carboxylesterase